MAFVPGEREREMVKNHMQEIYANSCDLEGVAKSNLFKKRLSSRTSGFLLICLASSTRPSSDVCAGWIYELIEVPFCI